MNNLINKVFSLALAFLAFSGSIATQAGAEIGLIDESKIFTEWNASKEAQTKISELRTKMQDLLTQLGQELEKASADKSVTEAQKLQKQKDAEKKFAEEKNKAEEIANSLREKMEEQMDAAIDAEAKSQKLDLVLSKEVTFFGGKDITDSVLKRLNSSK